MKRLSGLLMILLAFALGVVVARYAPLPNQPANALAAATQPATQGATRVGTQAATARVGTQAATQAATGNATLRTASTASATIPPVTSLATLTPSRTLLPPPTFEPPTTTPPPSPLPTATGTFTPFALGALPGLISGESPTPLGTPGCTVRKDWKLTYEVKANDALITIANLYNTNPDELVKGNCLSDKNKIYVGQVLHVPGKVAPTVPPFQCIPIQNLTPVNGTLAIAGTGQMVFHWYGPRTPRNLIRVFAPDGTKIEYVVELRQDYTIDLFTIKQAGTYTWYVYPLDANFVQPCPEGGPWTFTKAPAPTSTPTTIAAGTPIGR